ncbi:SDR family oxidoreductase [Pseudomonas sp. NY15435]|uniref:SDR family oxidoreductase n=1 Tax=Pseudomonas sp. NY15435 TaxID=3400358 RepID=UPI003A89B810
MNVLLLGARGFLGRHLLPALLAEGHQVFACARAIPHGPALPGVQWLALDLVSLADDPGTFVWPAPIDVVINATGVLSDDIDELDKVQARGPQQLFALAARNGARILQLSALGAGEHADIPFLVSKAVADQAALSHTRSVVLRPSLVLGPGGASSGWLAQLSRLPWVPLPDAAARLQPLHVQDLVGAVLALLRRWPERSLALPLVGPRAMTQRELLNLLRNAQGLRARRPPRLPWWCARGLSALGARLGWRMFSPQLLRLARRDNLASADELAGACGYRAAPLESRLLGWPDARAALFEGLRPVWLGVLAAIWIGTAVVCLGPGFDWGLRIMSEFGVDGWPAVLAVVVGALFDGILGIGLLLRRWRRPALCGQIALMLAYMLLISWRLPHYWFDPFMAVGKNFAILIANIGLLASEPDKDAA